MEDKCGQVFVFNLFCYFESTNQGSHVLQNSAYYKDYILGVPYTF